MGCSWREENVVPFEAFLDIKHMDEICGLCHGQESAVRAESEGSDSPHTATEHHQTFPWLPDVPHPCCGVLSNQHRLFAPCMMSLKR